MKLCNIGHSFDYECEKLIRIFLPFEKIEIIHTDTDTLPKAVCILEEGEKAANISVSLYLNDKCEKESCKLNTDVLDFDKVCELKIATLLYFCFVRITGYKAKWGLLTGVRPAKLFSRMTDSIGLEKAEDYFKNTLFVDQNKISLCKSAISGEKAITDLSRPNSFSLYFSVPFCPTRCSYCSFVSHSIDKAKNIIPKYVQLLCKELEETAKIAKRLNLRLETVYMGGGTPTTLTAGQLETVLNTVNSSFDMSKVREFTVEAGRPDTITKEKLLAIKKCGVTRISVNPQTLNDAVLEGIGRKHTAKQTVDTFNLARDLGFDNINMDLIAGLPDDTIDSFKDTLKRIIELNPESVTVHSLSLKRASSMSVNGELPEIKAGNIASDMVDFARGRLSEVGINPYYMYRQSKTVGNLENVGYAKCGFESLYNVYIMDETHTILACGASAVTKLRQPRGNLIERIFNFKYPYEYIDRFEQIISRKQGILDFYEKYPV